MATPSSPFSFLGDLFNRVGERLQPPDWAVHEIQHRVVLFLNHVLQQEPEAQQRLLRQQGRVVRFQWRFVTMELVATPAVDAATAGFNARRISPGAGSRTAITSAAVGLAALGMRYLNQLSSTR